MTGSIKITVPGSWEELYLLDLDVDFCVGIEADAKYTIGMFEPMYSETMSMDELVKSLEESMNISLSGAESGYENIQLEGYDGLRFELTETVEGIELTYLFTIINADEHIVQLVSWTASNLYDSYREEYIRIHDSFQVNRQYFD